MAKIKAFSPEFASAFKDEINKSSVYKQAGKGWKWTVGLVVEAEPDKNFPEAKGVLMDLFDGQARAIDMVSDTEAGKADFVISAPYSRWKQVMQRELDPTKGMMQGKLKLKGDLPTIVRYTRASQEMTECTTRIPVEFPDES
jgi:putative sterol carrier protein